MTAYLDANIVIYLVERHPVWGPKASSRVVQLRSAGDEIATSDGSRLECLVGPFILNDQTALMDYASFFNDPHIKMLPLSAAACERAARIRASHKIKPLDALHLGAAIEYGCGLFLTNDSQLLRCPDIPIEILT
jgi:predicted nucleic acid-binding protein